MRAVLYGMPALLLVACGGTASDTENAEATATAEAENNFSEWEARNPVAASPVTDDAEWVLANGILTFGIADMKPFFSIDCDAKTGILTYIRHERAPSEVKAMAAFVGDREKARWPVDATVSDNAVWKGQVSLDNPKIAVLTGGGSIELTIPGAGTLKMKGGRELPDFIRACEAVAPEPLAPSPDPNVPMSPPAR